MSEPGSRDDFADQASVSEAMAFFSEAGRGKSVLHIMSLARFNPGVIGLMGEEGAGRSTVLRKLEERVNQKQGYIAIIDEVVKTRTDLYGVLGNCFGIDLVGLRDEEQIELVIQKAVEGLLAEYRLVILALDGVQQFSIGMLEALINLMTRHRKLNLLLVGDNNLPAMLKHLVPEKTTRHFVALNPLNTAEVRQFLQWRLPAHHLDDAEFAQWVSVTHGNPGLLERESRKFEAEEKRKAAERGSFGKLFSNRRVRIALGVSAVLVLVAVVSFVAFSMYQSRQQEAAAKAAVMPAVVKPVSKRPAATSAPAVDVQMPAALEADENSRPMLDRQIELLTDLPDEDVTPKAPVVAFSVPPPVEKQVIAEPAPAPAPVVKTPVEAPVVVVAAKPVQAVPVAPAPVAKPVGPVVASGDEAALLQIDPGHYTIQVMGGRSRQSLEDRVHQYKQDTSVFIVRIQRDGKDWYLALYGDYADKRAATDALASLPDALKGNSPWLRRISEIQALLRTKAGN